MTYTSLTTENLYYHLTKTYSTSLAHQSLRQWLFPHLSVPLHRHSFYPNQCPMYTVQMAPSRITPSPPPLEPTHEDPLICREHHEIALENLRRLIRSMNHLTSRVRNQQRLYWDSPLAQQVGSAYLRQLSETALLLQQLERQINLSLYQPSMDPTIDTE